MKPEVEYSREALRIALDRIGVEYRPIVAGNFANQLMLKHMNVHGLENLPNADLIQDRGLFIGNHHYDVTDHLKMIAEVGRYPVKEKGR